MPVREFKELRGAPARPQRCYENLRALEGGPREETYSLTDQIRRSSRSVCANIAEAWRKRRYENHVVSKLSDADAEAAEPRTWLQFGWDSGCLSGKSFEGPDSTCNHICGGLANIMKNPEPWCGPNTACEPGIPYDSS